MKPRWAGNYGEQWTRERQAMELDRTGWRINERPEETSLRNKLLKTWGRPESQAQYGYRRASQGRVLDKLSLLMAIDGIYGRARHRSAKEGE